MTWRITATLRWTSWTAYGRHVEVEANTAAEAWARGVPALCERAIELAREHDDYLPCLWPSAIEQITVAPAGADRE